MYKVKHIPPTVYYIPNFINKDHENTILHHVYSAPKPKWTCLSNRRVQDYGGVPHKNGMIVEKIPYWLEEYMEKIDQIGLFEGHKTNHVLVNEYLPGQGIMAHSDGPLFYPTITTISCGSHTVLEFVKNNESREKVCDLLLQQRSLVIIKDDMYSEYLHSISERLEDTIDESVKNLNYCGEGYTVGKVIKRLKRVSLTIRNVPKVCKVKFWNL